MRQTRCPRQILSGIKTTEGSRFHIHNTAMLVYPLPIIQPSGLSLIMAPPSRPSRIFNGFDGMKIVNTGSLSKLVFFNVSEGDYGNYTCVAINKLGSSNTSFLLFGE